MQPNTVIVTNNNVGKGHENSLSLFKWMQMDEDREKFQFWGVYARSRAPKMGNCTFSTF